MRDLQSPAFCLWGTPTSWAELFGFVTGALCVWLVARQNIWSWPIGLLNNALFFVLFVAAKLYADATLQIVFGLLGVYGWYRWLRPGGAGVLPVRRSTRREWLWLGISGAVGTGLGTYWLAATTDSPVPFWDSTILILSLLATYGQANKLVESWWLWIAVDIISIPVYASRSLYLTSVLYAGFLLLCIAGLRSWSRALVEGQRVQPA